MADETPSAWRFADHRTGGRFAVTAGDGSPVATIERRWFAQGAAAAAADGSALCSVRRRHGLSRYTDLMAADGSSLGYLERGIGHHEVVLRDGRRLQLRPRWFGQGWVLVDPDGSEVLSSVRWAVRDRSREQLETGRLPAGSRSIRGYRFHHEAFITVGPDDWLVTPDGSLTPAQTIAIVEAYRMLVRTARNHRQ